jgi:hypothetical protein
MDISLVDKFFARAAKMDVLIEAGRFILHLPHPIKLGAASMAADLVNISSIQREHGSGCARFISERQNTARVR